MIPEAKYLRARCGLILDALERVEPGPPLLPQIRSIVHDAAMDDNVRGLRTVRRDLIEMAGTLPLAERERLEMALAAQERDDPINSRTS